MLLIYFLIVFFISLFIYQIILAFYPNSLIEGMETNSKDKNKTTGATYENYPTDPLILGKQNAGNIEYLKSQVDTLSSNTTDKLIDAFKIFYKYEKKNLLKALISVLIISYNKVTKSIS